MQNNKSHASPPSPTTILSSGDVASLDGLRAVSVFIVMLSHSGLGFIVPGGFGVTMFFFISGFIITTLLVREWTRKGQIGIRDFYIRRAIRLYPALAAFVAITALAGWLAGRPSSGTGVLGGFLYFMNYLVIFSPHSVLPHGNHLWSLAVEVHFYLFFPLLFAWLARDFGKLALALAGICLASLVIRCAAAIAFSDPALIYEYAYQASEARIDSIAVGALCAILLLSAYGAHFAALITRPSIVAAGAALLVSTLVIRHPVFRDTIRYSLQGLALIPIVAALVLGPGYSAARTLLNSRPFVLVGALSYSLYLWHPAIFELGQYLVGSKVLGLTLGWVLTIAIAAASYFWIERPMLALRSRFGSAMRSGVVLEAPLPQSTDSTQSSTDSPALLPRTTMHPNASHSAPILARVDGWPINLANRSDALRTLTNAAIKGDGFSFCPLNLDLLVKLRTDTAFIDAMQKADFVIADGWPIAMMARRDDPRIERTTGADLIIPLAEAAARHRLPIYLFGTSPEVLRTVSRKLTERCPGLHIAGLESPQLGFAPMSEAADAAIDRIQASGAKLCFLALGAPKQEILAARALAKGVKCGFVCVGAGLDFIAGAQVRAPELMRNNGMEWLWRMVTNPRRLAGRYAVCALHFGRLALQDGLFRRRA